MEMKNARSIVQTDLTVCHIYFIYYIEYIYRLIPYNSNSASGQLFWSILIFFLNYCEEHHYLQKTRAAVSFLS